MGVLAPVTATLYTVMPFHGLQQTYLGMGPRIFYRNIRPGLYQPVQEVYGHRIPLGHTLVDQQGNFIDKPRIVQFYHGLNRPPANTIGTGKQLLNRKISGNKGYERKSIESTIRLQKEKFFFWG